MSLPQKVAAVVESIAREQRPAAWIAFLLFMLKADEGRYKLKSAGPALLIRLADRLPMYGLWPSISSLLTGRCIAEHREIISALPEISIDPYQVQRDLRLIASNIARREVEADPQGRTNLDPIGRVLAEVHHEAIESPQQFPSAG